MKKVALLMLAVLFLGACNSASEDSSTPTTISAADRLIKCRELKAFDRELIYSGKLLTESEKETLAEIGAERKNLGCY